MNTFQIYNRFPKQEDCLKHVQKVRWQDKPLCPYCGSTSVSAMRKEQRFHCNTCNTSFSVTVGTIFHKTKVDLQKWFLAIGLVLNTKRAVGARQLARDIEVNKNTACFMLTRIRQAMIE